MEYHHKFTLNVATMKPLMKELLLQSSNGIGGLSQPAPKCWDIEKAYVWSELDPKDLIILKYPKGFERHV